MKNIKKQNPKLLQSKEDRQKEIKKIKLEIERLEFEKKDFTKRSEHYEKAWADRDEKVEFLNNQIEQLKSPSKWGQYILDAKYSVQGISQAFSSINASMRFFDKEMNQRPTQEEFETHLEKVRVARDRIARYHNYLKTVYNE